MRGNAKGGGPDSDDLQWPAGLVALPAFFCLPYPVPSVYPQNHKKPSIESRCHIVDARLSRLHAIHACMMKSKQLRLFFGVNDSNTILCALPDRTIGQIRTRCHSPTLSSHSLLNPQKKSGTFVAKMGRETPTLFWLRNALGPASSADSLQARSYVIAKFCTMQEKALLHCHLKLQ